MRDRGEENPVEEDPGFKPADSPHFQNGDDTYVPDREILVNQNLLEHEGRFRFTCAHELGHFVMHAGLQACFREVSEPGTLTEDRIERQADRFAAAFLMPVPMFEQVIVSICVDLHSKASEVLIELMMPTVQSESLWREMVLPAICRRFGVSRTAAAIRCHGLVLSGADPRTLIPTRFFMEIMDPRPAGGRWSISGVAP